MKRGEIWSINLDPTVGLEIRKTRPALILSVNAVGALPVRVIVPFTGWKDHFSSAPWLVRVRPDDGNGLTKESAADTMQMRSVSEHRFVDQLGVLGETDFDQIVNGVRLILGL